MNEPSVVTINTETNRPIAVGAEARDMLGKTPGKIQAIRPLKDGVIADFQITEILLTHFINKLNLKGVFSRPTILILSTVVVHLILHQLKKVLFKMWL